MWLFLPKPWCLNKYLNVIVLCFFQIWLVFTTQGQQGLKNHSISVWLFSVRCKLYNVCGFLEVAVGPAACTQKIITSVALICFWEEVNIFLPAELSSVFSCGQWWEMYSNSFCKLMTHNSDWDLTHGHVNWLFNRVDKLPWKPLSVLSVSERLSRNLTLDINMW